MESQVTGRERNRYLRLMVTRVVLSWDQNCTPWVSPLQSSLKWARFLAHEMGALRDVGSWILGDGAKGLKRGDDIPPRP